MCDSSVSPATLDRLLQQHEDEARQRDQEREAWLTEHSFVFRHIRLYMTISFLLPLLSLVGMWFGGTNNFALWLSLFLAPSGMAMFGYNIYVLYFKGANS